MKELLFGTAGIPFSTEPRNTVNGVITARKLGLGCMELEFVRNVNVSKEAAPEVKQAAKENKIELSCHCSYYINLAAIEKEKRGASRSRLVQAATRLDESGGTRGAVFHPGFYMKRDAPTVYPIVLEQMKKARKELDDKGHNVTLRPETSGKLAGWGTLKETLRVCNEVENTLPCIDISHLHAITQGGYNKKTEFEDLFNDVEKELGKQALRDMHFHAQGIEYTERGERNHLPIDESDFNYRDFLLVLKEYKIAGTVICEAPDPEADVLKMHKIYQKL
ncbi:MAG: TIM barrel protein [DPANN group archaeon]|nr:TIM barrel protein [DPANN group archaeon]